MKPIAILLFTIIFLLFIIIQTFILISINKMYINRAKLLGWINLVIIGIGTYATFIFLTDYLSIESFSSSLNTTQNILFILYMLCLFIYQVFESIQLKKVKESNTSIVLLSLVARAISMLYMMAYMSIFTLP